MSRFASLIYSRWNWRPTTGRAVKSNKAFPCLWSVEQLCWRRWFICCLRSRPPGRRLPSFHVMEHWLWLVRPSQCAVLELGNLQSNLMSENLNHCSLSCYRDVLDVSVRPRRLPTLTLRGRHRRVSRCRLRFITNELLLINVILQLCSVFTANQLMGWFTACWF